MLCDQILLVHGLQTNHHHLVAPCGNRVKISRKRSFYLDNSLVVLMFRSLQSIRQTYPSQFLLIIVGLLISTTGRSMIWPFLTIYVSDKLDLPLTEVAALITLSGTVALVSSFVAGPIADRVGRKWLMVISLAASGLTYLFFIQAETFTEFALLMALRGLFQPLFKVGTNAMVTDLVQPEKRPDAFALMRMSDNVGVAIGPAIGGFIAVSSYTIGFTIAAITMIFYSLMIAFFARETMPQQAIADKTRVHFQGYGDIVKDKKFMAFILSFTLFEICSVMLWVLMGVYAKQNYQLPESAYGLIQATNALMVVLFQVSVTRITKRFLPLPVLALGSLIYAIGVASIVLGQGFWGFWLSYVVVTIGELMVMPTANTYVADLAPVDQRGRYMGFFALAQGTAGSVSPLMGGILNDRIGPKAIWLGAGLIGICGSIGFGLMSHRETHLQKLQQTSSQSRKF
jgi:MFS family permease